MIRFPRKDTIIALDSSDPSDRWVPVPNPSAGTLRLKGLYKKRGNCYFARGIPKTLTAFCYRSAFKLGLRDRVLIFSRGAVKKKGRSGKDRVSITDLDWGVGTSIIIPRSLRKDERLGISVNGVLGELRIMELIVLAGLFKLGETGSISARHYAMAAQVMLHGWKALNRETPPRFSIVTREKAPGGAGHHHTPAEKV